MYTALPINWKSKLECFQVFFGWKHSSLIFQSIGPIAEKVFFI